VRLNKLLRSLLKF